jgi:esterase/lipase
MKILKILLIVLAVLALAYFLGPRAHCPELQAKIPSLDIDLSQLDNYINEHEAGVENLKADNQARVIWADSSGIKTPYSIVYLHGFSASPMEGFPVHQEIARRFGANLYLARLYGHGIDEPEAFLDLTPQKLMSSAAEALAIGKLLGDSVIVMSCSTGGTLSAYLAAHLEGIHSLILYSPNFDFADRKADMLTKPWGLQLARLIFKGKYRSLADWPDMAPYWTMRYRLEGLIQVKLLVERTMQPKTFRLIRQPLFIGYYYKNEEEQDDIVSVAAMRNFFDQVQTPQELKREVAFENVNSHVIVSNIQSHDVPAVMEETAKFCRDVLRMPETHTDLNDAH